MNSSQTAATATSANNNRITFTSQQLPNGTINIGGQGGAGGVGPTIISTAQLPNTTTIKTITAGIGGHGHGVPGLSQVHHQVQQQQQQQHQQQQQQQQQQSVGATQTQTLVIKSNHHAVVTLPAGLVSSAPAGIVTMTKTINQVSITINLQLQNSKLQRLHYATHIQAHLCSLSLFLPALRPMVTPVPHSHTHHKHTLYSVTTFA